jgi:hypothetical protein
MPLGKRKFGGPPRTEFVGARIAPETRAVLEREADRLGATLSRTLETIILAHGRRSQPQPEAAEAASA